MIKDLNAKDKILKLTESEHKTQSNSFQTLDTKKHRAPIPERMELNTRKIATMKAKTHIKRGLKICRGFPWILSWLLIHSCLCWESGKESPKRSSWNNPPRSHKGNAARVEKPRTTQTNRVLGKVLLQEWSRISSRLKAALVPRK